MKYTAMLLLCLCLAFSCAFGENFTGPSDIHEQGQPGGSAGAMLPGTLIRIPAPSAKDVCGESGRKDKLDFGGTGPRPNNIMPYFWQHPEQPPFYTIND